MKDAPVPAALGNPPQELLLPGGGPYPLATGSAWPSECTSDDSQLPAAAAAPGESDGGAVGGARAVLPEQEQLAWIIVPDWPEPADLDD
jgi:hypothetical protein